MRLTVICFNRNELTALHKPTAIPVAFGDLPSNIISQESLPPVVTMPFDPEEVAKQICCSFFFSLHVCRYFGNGVQVEEAEGVGEAEEVRHQGWVAEDPPSAGAVPKVQVIGRQMRDFSRPTEGSHLTKVFSCHCSRPT